MTNLEIRMAVKNLGGTAYMNVLTDTIKRIDVPNDNENKAELMEIVKQVIPTATETYYIVNVTTYEV